MEEEETLEAVEAAVRESGSVKKISVECRDLAWTNVATAILKGATENQSLRELALQMLRINVEEWSVVPACSSVHSACILMQPSVQARAIDTLFMWVMWVELTMSVSTLTGGVRSVRTCGCVSQVLTCCSAGHGCGARVCQ